MLSISGNTKMNKFTISYAREKSVQKSGYSKYKKEDILSIKNIDKY